MTVDFYDEEWNHQDFHEPKVYPFSKESHPCPKNFELMKKLAHKLSKNNPFLRVDFYEIDNMVFFGELTFFPTSGMGGFSPEEWDKIMGREIVLP